MSNLYPGHHAEALLNKLAVDSVLRDQLLRNPQETLSAFGFEIDPNELSATPTIASEAVLADSAALTRRQRDDEKSGQLAIMVFVLK